VAFFAIYIKKDLKAKEEFMETPTFDHSKNIIFKKNPLKETKKSFKIS
jgi:hypothetical protein